MKKRIVSLLFLICLGISFRTTAQSDPEKAACMQNGRFVLAVDLSWNHRQQLKFAELYDIDTLLLRRLFSDTLNITKPVAGWTVQIVKPGLLELSKNINELEAQGKIFDDIVLSNLPNLIGLAPEEDVSYGTNEFTDMRAFNYDGEVACFFLPAIKNAHKVMLSGSFNNWNTMLNPMKATDSGWILCMNLNPGKYTYKFIVDGNWKHDPNNKAKEKNEHGSYNSVVYCYNHTFTLNGYQNASKVNVTGSFNNWKENELKMTKTTVGWRLPMYLRNGTHSYKFIVDGEWINDPASKSVRPDGKGNFNSFLGIGDTLLFRLNGFTNAKEVILTGNFNDWNTGELFMKKTTTGWELPYVTGSGNFEYKFIVDGRWMTDPANPCTTGSGDMMNSFISFDPTYTFKLAGFPDAKEVFVTGSFSGWREDGYRMSKHDGLWEFPLHLEPGRYSYKFIVDGKWILDESNPLWEGNEYGTDNSVLWIQP